MWNLHLQFGFNLLSNGMSQNIEFTKPNNLFAQYIDDVCLAHLNLRNVVNRSLIK